MGVPTIGFSSPESTRKRSLTKILKMCVYVFGCLCVSVCLRMSVFVYAGYACVCLDVCVYLYMPVFVCAVYVCICVSFCVCVCVFLCACMCVNGFVCE